MGGDGGTKAVQRSYLRGAGSASTTADAARHTGDLDPAIVEEEIARSFRHCAITGEPLDFGSPIVACPYGRLQGVMLDKNSIVVAYDYVRGELRGKFRKGASGDSPLDRGKSLR